MPSVVAPVRVGIPRDLLVIKVKTFEGLFEKTLSVGIERIVVMLLSKSMGAFLQSRRCARASWPWAVLGDRALREATPALGRWAAGPEWVAAGPFLFLMHF